MREQAKANPRMALDLELLEEPAMSLNPLDAAQPMEVDNDAEIDMSQVQNKPNIMDHITDPDLPGEYTSNNQIYAS
jgi:hypothetical protein